MRESTSKKSAALRPTVDRRRSIGTGAAVTTNVSAAESVATEVLRINSGTGARADFDFIAREEPLEIRVRGRSIAVTMRTPGRDDELAAGFLLSEGLIRQRSDVVEIAHCRRGETTNYQNTLNVFLSPAVDVNFEQLTRHVFAS